MTIFLYVKAVIVCSRYNPILHIQYNERGRTKMNISTFFNVVALLVPAILDCVFDSTNDV